MNAAGSVAHAFALHDPARLEALLTGDEPHVRAAAAMALAFHLAEQDPVEALQALRQLDEQDAGSAANMVVGSWLSARA